MLGFLFYRKDGGYGYFSETTDFFLTYGIRTQMTALYSVQYIKALRITYEVVSPLLRAGVNASDTSLYRQRMRG
jgi:hypothetical protein